MIKYTKESFISKAMIVHVNRYDYSKVDYVNNRVKVKIICPIHGDFMITPQKHLSGQGCRKCGYLKNVKEQSSTTDEFINKAKKIHGDKFDYSKVEYINNSTKVCIICPIHGEFWQTPNSHLNGRGCRKCGIENRTLNQRSNDEEFIEKSKFVHGDTFDYSKVKYVTNKTPVIISCKIHGDFIQTPTHHLNGEGCPKCKYITISKKQLLSTDVILSRFIETHGAYYDYSKVEYNGIDTKVCIICPKHGEFWQEPWAHINGCGCPKCASTLSINETELLGTIKQWIGNDNVKERVRNLFDDKKEYDIVIPSHKLCIEYNGLYWHSDKFERIKKNYHLEKTISCDNNGYRLIHIFEDEYIYHKDIVLSKIKNILGINDGLVKINARNCSVNEINSEIAKAFLEKNHIQGYVNSTVHFGLFFNNSIIGVMSFKKESKKENKWELTRFAVDINLVVRGGGGKLFTHFIRNYDPDSVKSFADRRWSVDNENNLYSKLGFVLEETLRPDYKYFNSRSSDLQRIHKFNCRKERLHKKYGLPMTMTEKEMTNELKFYRIYDCGLFKYVWTKPK